MLLKTFALSRGASCSLWRKEWRLKETFVRSFVSSQLSMLAWGAAVSDDLPATVLAMNIRLNYV